MKNLFSKILWVLLVLIAIFPLEKIYSQTCDITITSSSPYIDALASQYKSVKPGSTVCLQAGNWNYVQIQNFHGTQQQPITFINKGGAVIIDTDHFVGIKIGNCSHVIFRGDGDPSEKYGFRVLKVSKGAGMGVGDLSTNVEVSHVELSNTAIGGLYAKTDPNCSYFKSTRDKFTMYNFSFHDSYIHDTKDEGMYIGNSHYTGLHLTGACDTVVYPHVLKGVEVYNNIVENTGYDGIQVSSAVSGCSIHDNQINFDSQAGVLYQMSGIMIGGGSVCKTYNNKIINGKGDGIDVFGMGNFNIFNNLIVNVGRTYFPNNPNIQKHGIFVGVDTVLNQAILGIYNNTIVSPKTFGIKLTNNKLKQTRVINNLITTPGKYADVGSAAFINSDLSQDKLFLATNYTSNSIPAVKFIDPNNYNFDLQPDSPAIDYGTNLTAEGVTFDIDNRSRPYHGYFDAGAYEPHNPSVGIQNRLAADLQSMKLYPNPISKKKAILEFTVNKTQPVGIFIRDITGRIIKKYTTVGNAWLPQKQNLNLDFISPGIYILTIKTIKGKSSLEMIIHP